MTTATVRPVAKLGVSLSGVAAIGDNHPCSDRIEDDVRSLERYQFVSAPRV